MVRKQVYIGVAVIPRANSNPSMLHVCLLPMAQKARGSKELFRNGPSAILIDCIISETLMAKIKRLYGVFNPFLLNLIMYTRVEEQIKDTAPEETWRAPVLIHT
jgi:hypothetical protein